MRGFLAVFEREIVERRMLAAAALLLGLVPLAAPLLPGLEGNGGPEVRSATALALALCFSLGLALILGGSIIVRDLAERRLGFYFSRPVAGPAIWSGKLSAALVLALGAGFLVLLPTVLLERRLDIGELLSARLFLLQGEFPSMAVSASIWAATVLLLVALSHAANVALRSRSPWLILDLAALGLVAVLTWAATHRLTFASALGAAEVTVMALAGAVLLSLLAASAVQVLKGRTDMRRGHRLLSFTLWGALLAAGFAAHGYASWVLATEPTALEEVGISAVASRNPWIAIYGPARHRVGYRPQFLLDTSTGRFTRVRYWLPPRFSADGRWAVWLESASMRRPEGPYELLRMDLRDPGSQPERTGMTFARGNPPLLAVSADGRQVAVAAGRRLTLEEVPSGRLLASAELARELDHAGNPMFFVGPGRARIVGSGLFSNPADERNSPQLEVGEITVAGGDFVQVARLDELAEPAMNTDSPWLPPYLEINADGSRLLARRRSDRRFLVIDTGTGAVTAELPPAGERSYAAFLADGRIALVTGSRQRELQIFSRDFAPERRFRFSGSGLRLGGQPAPDRLIVATGPRSLIQNQILLLSLSTGAVRQLGRGLVPVAHSHVGPESVGPTLFWRSENWRLVQVDTETGQQRIIAGRRSG